MRIIKLTKQYNGHQYFKYCVNYTYKDFQQFINHREWCWVNWGASSEIEFYGRSQKNNSHWAWICDSYRLRIYLAREQDASHFMLRWSEQ